LLAARNFGTVGLQLQHAAEPFLDVCRSKLRTLNEMEHNVRDVFLPLFILAS